MKLHQDSLNKTITLRGKEEVISEILANKEEFRIKSETEAEGITVSSYRLEDIEKADKLVVII